MQKDAWISRDGRYRYTLTRSWDQSKPSVLFVMLNPSTADAEHDDPTVEKCVHYAQRWGYGSLVIVNLFALRSSDPDALLEAEDPIGPNTNGSIQYERRMAAMCVVAWGERGAFLGRFREVLPTLGEVHALKVNASGQPSHPLYLADDLDPAPYRYKPGG